MKLGIDWSQASTIRGIVWTITAVVGGVMIWQGKSVDQLLILATGVSGALGVTLKD
jgi:hypothetical protein